MIVALTFSDRQVQARTTRMTRAMNLNSNGRFTQFSSAKVADRKARSVPVLRWAKCVKCYGVVGRWCVWCVSCEIGFLSDEIDNEEHFTRIQKVSPPGQ